MKAHTLLVKAAQLIDEKQQGFCCIAISRAYEDFTHRSPFDSSHYYRRDSALSAHNEARNLFEAMFAPSWQNKGAMPFWSNKPNQHAELRVMCLLLAAAVAQGGGL